MPMLIVEDGMCPEGANAYVSLADADTYCLARGLWADSSGDATVAAKKEIAILRASDWLNGLDWRGEPISPLRVMAWPRLDVRLSPAILLDSNVVPAVIVNACCEVAALFFGGTDLMAAQEHGGVVQSMSSQVGTLSESVTYGANAPTETLYPAIKGLIDVLLRSAPWRKGGSGVIEAGRG